MEAPRVLRVYLKKDKEAGVWYVEESDVPGLNLENEDVDALVEELKTVVPELLEANGVFERDDDNLPAVPIEVLFGRFEAARLIR